MPESGTYGSVRGAPSNGRPYRDQNTPARHDAPSPPWHLEFNNLRDPLLLMGRGCRVTG